MYRILIALLLTLCLTGTAVAGDKEDVLAATDAVIAAWNGTDVDAIKAHYAPEFSIFQGDGNLLAPEGYDWDNIRTLYDNGLKLVVGPGRHREVAIFGNTALVVGYMVVTVTMPGEEPRTTTDRTTWVWVKRDGAWKVVHQHFSLLTPPQPE